MNKPERNLFSNNFCEQLDIEKADYAGIYEKIVNARPIDEISDSKIKELLEKTLDKTLTNTEGSFNEIVVYSPKSAALFSKAKNIEDIPFALRKYAQDKNIPIIDISKLD